MKFAFARMLARRKTTNNNINEQLNYLLYELVIGGLVEHDCVVQLLLGLSLGPLETCKFLS